MALVTLRAFRDPIDAELTKALLESHGIRVFLFDQHLASIQWLFSYAIGGVKVKVEETDLDAACEALGSTGPDDLEAIPENQRRPTDAGACPACGSFEVATSRVQRIAAAASLATGLPLIAWRRRWVCHSCGHTWKRGRAAAAIAPETIEAEGLVHERRQYPAVRGILAALLGLAVLWYVQHRIRNP